MRQWTVVVEGVGQKLISGVNYVFVEEFVVFVDGNGERTYTVRRDAVISIEPYTEPPF